MHIAWVTVAKFIENPDVQDGQIQFSSCVNQKYAYGLEDIVLGALEKQGSKSSEWNPCEGISVPMVLRFGRAMSWCAFSGFLVDRLAA